MDVREVSSICGEKVERHPWELARLEVIRKLIERFSRDISNRSSIILDMGCGDAFVTQELAIRFPKAIFIGIDQALDSPIVEQIQLKPAIRNLEIYRTLDEIPYVKECVDIVLFLDVLEHVEDDVLFLRSVSSSSLVKNATFVITVPAFQCLFSSRDRFLNHFRRYSCRQLIEVVYRAQMKTVEYGYFFSSLLVPRLVQVILERIRIVSARPGTSLSRWRGFGFLDSLLRWILVYDFAVSEVCHRFNFLLPGLSCYVIARR